MFNHDIGIFVILSAWVGDYIKVKQSDEVLHVLENLRTSFGPVNGDIRRSVGSEMGFNR